MKNDLSKIKQLLNLANHLDKKGMYKEADMVDDIIKKYSQLEGSFDTWSQSEIEEQREKEERERAYGQRGGNPGDPLSVDAPGSVEREGPPAITNPSRILWGNNTPRELYSGFLSFISDLAGYVGGYEGIDTDLAGANFLVYLQRGLSPQDAMYQVLLDYRDSKGLPPLTAEQEKAFDLSFRKAMGYGKIRTEQEIESDIYNRTLKQNTYVYSQARKKALEKVKKEVDYKKLQNENKIPWGSVMLGGQPKVVFIDASKRPPGRPPVVDLEAYSVYLPSDWYKDYFNND